MFEKRWAAIAPQLFTTDGQANGKIELADTAFFKVKQKIIITANGEPNLELEVKAVVSDKILYVGKYGSIAFRSDLSAYTLAKAASIFAEEQVRSGITADEIRRARFDEEPTVADRSVLVDKYGRYFDDSNPVPIEGTISIADGSSVKTPTITNITFAFANTEQVIVIPSDTKRFRLQVRGGLSKCKFSYSVGQSGVTYMSIDYGNSYSEDGLDLLGNLNLYVQVSKTNQVIELITWK